MSVTGTLDQPREARDLWSTAESALNAAAEVRRTFVLAEWIESARQTLDELRVAADFDEKLRERLHAHQIAFASPLWTAEESSALLALLMSGEGRVRDVEKTTEQVMRAAKAIKEPHHV